MAKYTCLPLLYLVSSLPVRNEAWLGGEQAIAMAPMGLAAANLGAPLRLRRCSVRQEILACESDRKRRVL